MFFINIVESTLTLKIKSWLPYVVSQIWGHFCKTVKSYCLEAAAFSSSDINEGLSLTATVKEFQAQLISVSVGGLLRARCWDTMSNHRLSLEFTCLFGRTNENFRLC